MSEPNQVLPTTPDPEAVQLLYYVRTLWKRKWLILLFSVLGVGAAYLWARAQIRIYQADCTIEYEPHPPKPFGSMDDMDSAVMYFETHEYYATQNKILTSRSVAERVVRKLSLQENPEFWGIPSDERESWKTASITDTAQLLRALLTVTQERDTRLVHILVRDTNPDRAALLANGVADSYLEKTMEDRLGSTTGALEWLGKQLDTLKRQLEQSELALHEFSEEHTNLAVSFEDQQNIIAANIQQISRSLTDARTRRIELEARLKELQASDSSDPMQMQTVLLNNVTISALRERYRELLVQKDSLIVNLGDAHPRVVSIDAQLDGAKRALRAEADALIGAVASEVSEIRSVEKGLQGALDQANRIGLELNLQDITHRRLQRERDNTSKLYGALLERTTHTDLARALQLAYARIIDRALAPVAPISPRVGTIVVAGAILGLLFGLGAAITLEQLDRVIRTAEDAEASGITVLGVLPHIGDQGASSVVTQMRRKQRRGVAASSEARDLVIHNSPKSSVAECCRTIRTNITFMSADSPRKTLVVTSASPREGKTTVSISLAISLAQSGKRTLIVDTDLRKPRIHRAFGRPINRGVTNILVGEHTASEAIQETEVPGLSLLSSGPIPPNPSELLHSEQFASLLTELARQFDHVILDSPPLTAVTDAAIIAPQVDAAIIVVHTQRTTRDVLRSALKQLRDVHGQLLGGILNDVDLASKRYGSSSYYYYRDESYYEAGDDGSNDGGVQPAAPA